MVDIVMATYNGARYVDEQIRSFCRQSYRDWRCLVHDDGSTDGTPEILRAWAKRDKRIVFIEDGVTGLKPAKHFIHILQYSDAPMVMWSDQDDVWFERKIETLVQAAEEADFRGAGVVYSNAELWNEERGVIASRNTLYYPRKVKDALFLNSGIQGSAALFNGAMREILKQPLRSYAMHDHVLLLAGLTLGEVVYVDEPLMYYRQHADNVTGHAPGSKSKKVRLMWANRHVPVVSKEHLEGLRAFYEQYKDEIKKEDGRLIEIFLHLPMESWWQRWRKIRENQFTLMGSRYLLQIKLLIRRYI